MESWAAAKKIVSAAMPPAPVRVPSQRPLAPRVASVTSVANDICALLYVMYVRNLVIFYIVHPKLSHSHSFSPSLNFFSDLFFVFKLLTISFVIFTTLL